MIYVRLNGGLGNQLFQFAAAQALALRRGTRLVLDRRMVDRAPAPFGYALRHFAIDAIEEGVALPPDRTRLPAYLTWRFGGGRPRFLREQGLGFNAAVAEAPDDTYLHGYFQTEKYFADSEEELRRQLRIVTRPSAENARWLGSISDQDGAVSVHVRRGDYVADARGARTHGTCSEAYYRDALEAIASRSGGDPVAYVFSNDPDWARDNLRLGCETVVLSHNDPSRHYEDLRLMSACRHHVIANSSFSWWGAWLNPSAEKIVAAPARWFADPRLDNPDILPESWVRIAT